MRFLIYPRFEASEAEAAKGCDPTGAPLDLNIFAAYMKFNEDLAKAGVLIASEGLNPAVPPAQVKAAGGKRRVVDGPFAESKELVGGFYLIDVKSREEAIEWALRCPIGLGHDVLEIRQLTAIGDLPTELQEIIRTVAPRYTALWSRGA